MPQFVMENRDSAAREFDGFTYGYIEALFFTETATGTTRDDWSREDYESGRDSALPGDASYLDFAPAALERIKADCAAFQAKAATALTLAYRQPGYSEEQAGRDYWFTRNGHGVGYWERDALKLEIPATGQTLGDYLSDAARYSEVNVSWDESESLIYVD